MNRYKLEVDSSSDLSLRAREQTLKWPTLVRNMNLKELKRAQEDQNQRQRHTFHKTAEKRTQTYKFR
jgi:hypothetical protein